MTLCLPQLKELNEKHVFLYILYFLSLTYNQTRNIMKFDNTVGCFDTNNIHDSSSTHNISFEQCLFVYNLSCLFGTQRTDNTIYHVLSFGNNIMVLYSTNNLSVIRLVTVDFSMREFLRHVQYCTSLSSIIK